MDVETTSTIAFLLIKGFNRFGRLLPDLILAEIIISFFLYVVSIITLTC